MFFRHGKKTVRVIAAREMDLRVQVKRGVQMINNVDGRSGSLTGLTDQEAREFHSSFMSGFLMFTAIAVVAHVLLWMWNPWFV